MVDGCDVVMSSVFTQTSIFLSLKLNYFNTKVLLNQKVPSKK